jgi:hypothetical protein
VQPADNSTSPSSRRGRTRHATAFRRAPFHRRRDARWPVVGSDRRQTLDFKNPSAPTFPTKERRCRGVTYGPPSKKGILLSHNNEDAQSSDRGTRASCRLTGQSYPPCHHPHAPLSGPGPQQAASRLPRSFQPSDHRSRQNLLPAPPMRKPRSRIPGVSDPAARGSVSNRRRDLLSVGFRQTACPAPSRAAAQPFVGSYLSKIGR